LRGPSDVDAGRADDIESRRGHVSDGSGSNGVVLRPDLFDGIGQLDGEVHLDVDPTVAPVHMPHRRLPIGVRDKVAAELQRMEADGIIAPVTEPSSWMSALLVVAKPDGRIRICIDLKPLNKALKRAHYPMPTIDDVLPQLSGAKIFGTVDAKDGFWHLKLDDESSRLTTFETPFGRYSWFRVPFGVSPHPKFSRPGCTLRFPT